MREFFMNSWKIREYLNYEYINKKKGKEIFSEESLPELRPEVPQQSNGTDCGLFLLQFVIKFFQVNYKHISRHKHFDHKF